MTNVRARSALLAASTCSRSPVVPTMMVASVGTIMMRPSLVQIGRSRRKLTGLVMRDDDVAPGALCSLLTSPPSEPALLGDGAPVTHRARWERGRPGEFHH